MEDTNAAPSGSGGSEASVASPSSEPVGGGEGGQSGSPTSDSGATYTGSRDGSAAEGSTVLPAQSLEGDEGEDGLIRPDAKGARKQIKPIKDKPSLTAKELAHMAVPKGPQKAPKGEVKPGSAVPGAPKAPLSTPLGKPAVPQAKKLEADGPVEFAGHVWKNTAELEQNFKSLQGQFRPMQQRIQESEQALQAVESAGYQWKELAEQREREIGEYRRRLGIDAGSGEPKEAVPVENAQEDPLDVLVKGDEVFQELMRQGQTDVAMRHLVHTALTNQQKAFDQKLDAAIAPYREERAMKTVTDTVGNMMIEAAGLTYADPNTGEASPVFPELQDGEGAAGVGRIWAHLSQGWQPEFAASPMAMYLSVLAYRDQQAAMGGGGTGAVPGTQPGGNGQAAQQVAQAIVGQIAAGEQSGEAVMGGAPPSVRTDTRGGADSFRRAIREAEPINSATGVPW